MPRITVEWIAGRSHEQREEIAKRITEALVDVAGTTPSSVGVVFYEYPSTHYFKGGLEWTRVEAERQGTSR